MVCINCGKLIIDGASAVPVPGFGMLCAECESAGDQMGAMLKSGIEIETVDEKFVIKE